MVSPDKYFYFSNGEVLRDLSELKEELEKNVKGINLHNFQRHVTDTNNDYANWVRGFFGKEDLANSFSKKSSPEDLLSILNEHLNGKKKKKKISFRKKNKTDISKPHENKRKKEKNYLKNLFKRNKKESDENISNDVASLDENNSENKTEVDVNKTKKEDVENSNDSDASNNVSEKIEQPSSTNDSLNKDSSTEKDFETSAPASLSERSEQLLEKTKKMKQNTYLNEEVLKANVSDINERYESLYSLISAKRRRGIDMLIPFMKLKLIKPKIHFLEVDNSFEARDKVKNLLDEVEEEIASAEQFVELDIKKEVLEKANVNGDVIKKNKLKN